MASESDRLFLGVAVELAARGLNSTTPNPRVGCLVVRDGVVIGRGWHVRAGEGHAEVNALADARAAGNAQRIAGATAYVSLEPCSHHGRTPPCSRALIDAGITRVVAAMHDPNPRVSGGGFAELAGAGVAVEVVELPEAQTLNAGYVSRLSRGRPLVRLKVAASLDGRTAMASGESRWVTGEAARADVQTWRARSCAVITGADTVLADDPALTVRDPAQAVDDRIRQPLRVIADSHLRVGAGARLFGEPGAVLVAHTDGRPAHARAEFLQLAADAGGRVDLLALLEALAAREHNEVLVEAGPTLIGAFLRAGLWDELLLYVAPKLLGSDARPLAHLPIQRMIDAIEARIADRAQIGADLRLRLVPTQAR
ncbi:MAG: bifunctional diaminohydroxyphosphoribosylaminopyrimidine deaminase/5-amino-6-(5-phosphoribosylamino)uracil reductase RibD [Pseudomonadales bacterium]